MKRRVLIFWRRTVVVSREKPTPAFPPFGDPPPYQPGKWGLWARIKYHVTGKGFRPYIPGRPREVALRRRFILLFRRKPRVPPYVPPPVVQVQRVVVVRRTGARREPWRWWMLFTARGADMTVGEWLQDKKLAVMDWPLTWRLGMILPGLLGGWLFWLRMGPEWNLRHCMFVGGFIGLSFPLLFLHFLESVYVVVVVGLVIGAAYWAFPEAVGGYLEFMGMMLKAVWKTVLVIWGKIRG